MWLTSGLLNVLGCDGTKVSIAGNGERVQGTIEEGLSGFEAGPEGTRRSLRGGGGGRRERER